MYLNAIKNGKLKNPYCLIIFCALEVSERKCGDFMLFTLSKIDPLKIYFYTTKHIEKFRYRLYGRHESKTSFQERCLLYRLYGAQKKT